VLAFTTFVATLTLHAVDTAVGGHHGGRHGD